MKIFGFLFFLCFWGSFWAFWSLVGILHGLGWGLRRYFRIHSCKLINFISQIFCFPIFNFFSFWSIWTYLRYTGLRLRWDLKFFGGLYSYWQISFIMKDFLFSYILIFCFYGHFEASCRPIFWAGVGSMKIFWVYSIRLITFIL